MAGLLNEKRGEAVSQVVGDTIDLSGSAVAARVLLHACKGSLKIHRIVVVYDEAADSSTVGAIATTFGTESHADGFSSHTSGATVAAYGEYELTLAKTQLSEGDSLIVASAGGGGAGRITPIVEYSPLSHA